MNTILLCEGKTDAVLLGYYIDKVCGYVHTKARINKQITVDIDRAREMFEWHIKGENYLAIWSVGGKDRFKDAIKIFCDILKKSPDDLNYQRFVLIGDRDLQKDDQLLLGEYGRVLNEIGVKLVNNKIETCEFKDSFGQTKSVKTLASIIPQDKLGALETVLLDSLKEDDYDRKIVEGSEGFISEVRDNAQKYITSDRLELKAKLSTVFAIMSPEKVFSFIDEILRTTIKWEDKESLRELFQVLIEFLACSEE